MDRLNRVKKIFLHFALFLAIMTHGFEINAVKKVSITIKSQSLHVCALQQIFFVSRVNLVRHNKQNKVPTDMKGGYNVYITFL